MGFSPIIFVWTSMLVGWDILAPKEFRFDPFPKFVLCLFISNLIQLSLMPLILIGQNVQPKHADLWAEVDYLILQILENRKSWRCIQLRWLDYFLSFSQGYLLINIAKEVFFIGNPIYFGSFFISDPDLVGEK